VNRVVTWLIMWRDLKVKVRISTGIYLRLNISTRIPLKWMHQWDRYRNPQNVFLLRIKHHIHYDQQCELWRASRCATADRDEADERRRRGTTTLCAASLHAHRRSASVRQFTGNQLPRRRRRCRSRPVLYVPCPCPAAYVHWVVPLLCHRRRVVRRQPCHSKPTWLSANSDAFFTELFWLSTNARSWSLVISTSTPSAVMTQRPRDSLIFCSVLAVFKTYH